MQALETILKDALEEAGTRALQLSRTGYKRWTKQDGSPVTEADLAADEILMKRLRPALPEAGWQSEESATEVPPENRFWIVDPIDGTAAFAGGEPGWCVAVALIHNGAPELAGIFAPVSGIFFTAVKGEGAKRNGQLITVSMRPELEGAHLIARAAPLAQHNYPPVNRTSLYSIALRLCAVAEGSKDGMLAIGPKQDWDIAAGDLIVREAGGGVSDLGGTPLRFGLAGHKRSGVIAAGAKIHPQMVAQAVQAKGKLT